MAFKISAEISNSPQFVFESTQTAKWEGIELTVASENIEKPTVWAINENRHALIVHLGGTINEIETEIDRRASKLNPPTDGEFWLIPANAEYFSFTRGETVRYAEFYFDLNYLEMIFGDKAKNYELMPHIGHFDNFLYQNVKQLTAIVSKSDDISNLMSENISQTLCLYLFSNYNTKSFSAGKQSIKFTPKKFSLLQEYIHDNLSERIMLENLAEIVGMTSHNLLRFFGKSFGKTPAQYIIEQRLRKVRWLLVNSKKDITTIAQETGFSSHSHLTTTFKSHAGITPNEFRLAN
ncbi:MAG: AraC family transcriptional regulator [Acidobacteriota bacterium]